MLLFYKELGNQYTLGKILFIKILSKFFIVTSLVILSIYQSQMTYLGNSINIAGKSRFITSNLMVSTAEYFMEIVVVKFPRLIILLINLSQIF
jgi:hypothetical protein